MTVTDFEAERRRRNRDYLAENRKRLDAVIEGFVQRDLEFDVEEVMDSYRNLQIARSDGVWSYQDVQDELLDVFERLVVDDLLACLAKEKWFDRRFVSRQWLAERCVGAFILHRRSLS